MHGLWLIILQFLRMTLYDWSNCGKAFQEKRIININQWEHTAESTQCNHLGKAFSVKGYLEKHVHGEEEPHLCSYCNKASSQKRCLDKH